MNQTSPDPKAVEYYAAQANAWFQTSLERDKSLLALSTAGIGVLIALITRNGQRTIEEAVLFILAILAFSVCALVVLAIFSKNQAHLEAEIQKSNNVVERHLETFDRIALASFGVGISLAVVIGIFTAIASTHGSNRVTETKVTVEEIQRTAQDGRLIESFAGPAKIAPQPDETKSFAGSGRAAPPEPVVPQVAHAPVAEQPAVTSDQSATSSETPAD